MDRNAVIDILREHEPELKAAGVASLRLFGSVARGDGGEQSDLIAEPVRKDTLRRAIEAEGARAL